MPALGHAFAGSVGAAISNICTYPLALIITRLQIQRQLRKNGGAPGSEEYGSIRDAFWKIYDQRGLLGFYVGLVQDTSKTIADSFLFFLLYNFLRQARLKRHKGSVKHLSAVDELGVGFLAGAFAKFFTTPLANVVTRKQALSMTSRGSTDSSSYDSSVRSIARQIRKEKGLQGFWSGYSASLVLTLNPSLTFFLFEMFKRTLLHRTQRKNPPAQATFLLAAFSKAIASTITYPFSLAKARAQASRKSDENEKNPATETPSQNITSAAERDKHLPGNVFSAILQIARNEGMAALYKGLDGEVLKGFFSHGITMLVKESIHKLIIQLYYKTLTLLRRFRPQDVAAATTKARIERAAGNTNRHATQLAASVDQSAGSASGGRNRRAKNPSFLLPRNSAFGSWAVKAER